ncbi:MAG: L-seryl-tRNA(Ser) seleniumtransferase [Desulfomicrobiaceae bacterium]|jgi:L-seryl-tRNA(Ser) seleniumtransferase|nr:L-seryl-tRNA(Ser) seleniumtransferase [Desulfomicrobiaceae bacterium]MDK2872874.1 L-seryl-tRNA(Ser) seleniumtransferase [Desulfomicrobiaceae bacterium]HCF05675.1 L-seryl-tRNA(Sec) selenium transferase [Desulfomicrobiaceae bacterium]
MSELGAFFRSIPAVDRILNALEAEAALADSPRALVREAVGRFLDLVREEIRQGAVASPADLALERLLPRVRAFVIQAARPKLRRVINATGVVVHTNLGRSVLAAEAVQAVVQAAQAYSNLEFDLATGQRGSRYVHVEELLCRLTGAEAAMVVNNNAAAVLLVLDTLAKGREVIVSRGQLVEIGGSFRIPEVMKKSGAILREVGATNRTHVRDYVEAIGPDTAAIMKVHTSNYRMVGFVQEVPAEELVALGRAHGLPVVEDLGSGNLMDFSAIGLGQEPTVRQVVAAGVDVVTMSGDKLLGGPQAGIIVGRASVVERLRKNQLTRALRIDKLTLAALEGTLRLYLDPEKAKTRIPTVARILMDPETLRRQATRLARRLRQRLGARAQVTVAPSVSRVGGGAFPEQDLPTFVVRVLPAKLRADAVRQRLLGLDVPVVVRVEEDAVVLDPRTLLAGDDRGVEQAMASVLCAESSQE